MFFYSCGDHYNPFGRQHGGPEDSDRVHIISIPFKIVTLDPARSVLQITVSQNI